VVTIETPLAIWALATILEIAGMFSSQIKSTATQPGWTQSLRLEAQFGLDKAWLGLGSARRTDKPSLNPPIKAQGSTNPLDDARKPARRLDARIFLTIILLHTQ
jgi:hypothetical protein